MRLEHAPYKDILNTIATNVKCLKVSKRYNAMYGLDTIHTMLLLAAKNGTCIESTPKILHNAISGGQVRIPSAKHVRNIIHGADPAQMEQDAVNCARYTYDELLKCGAIIKPCTVAIDINDKPRYDKKITAGMVKTRYKNGTSKMERHISMQCVDEGARMQIGAISMSRGETASEFVPKLVDIARKTGVKIQTILLDRGFFTSEIIKYFNTEKLCFVMPCGVDPIKGEHPKCYKFYLVVRGHINEKTTSLSRRKGANRHGVYKHTHHPCRVVPQAQHQSYDIQPLEGHIHARWQGLHDHAVQSQ